MQEHLPLPVIIYEECRRTLVLPNAFLYTAKNRGNFQSMASFPR